jgi:multidrug resistance efflux pump
MRLIRKILLFVLLVYVTISITGCDAIMADKDDGLGASGVVEAVEVVISPELGGRVVQVYVNEGDKVEPGDPMFRLEDDLLNAQRDQVYSSYEATLSVLETARAAKVSAQAALEAAQASVDVTQIQFQLELSFARLQVQEARTSAWNRDLPNEFSLPPWYFGKSDEIAAAEAEVQEAEDALEIEQNNYHAVLQDASNADLREAEIRLSEAQASFVVAEELLERDIAQQSREEVDDFAQSIYDGAKAELENAQNAYDNMLTDKAAGDVLEAKARLVVAQERYEIALDQLALLQTGSDALTVQAAEALLVQAEAGVTQWEANVAQAEAGILQAEKTVEQAEAGLDLIALQITKLTVRSAVAGVVVVRNVEPGEVIQPGVAAMMVSQQDNLTVTVYIPEDRYGQINLNDHARVTADSFPDEDFNASVIRIADKAEYTPRNVQTEEDRRTTVIAVELSVQDPDGRLKPGMPVDVKFFE